MNKKVDLGGNLLVASVTKQLGTNKTVIDVYTPQQTGRFGGHVQLTQDNWTKLMVAAHAAGWPVNTALVAREIAEGWAGGHIKEVKTDATNDPTSKIAKHFLSVIERQDKINRALAKAAMNMPYWRHGATLRDELERIAKGQVP